MAYLLMVATFGAYVATVFFGVVWWRASKRAWMGSKPLPSKRMEAEGEVTPPSSAILAVSRKVFQIFSKHYRLFALASAGLAFILTLAVVLPDLGRGRETARPVMARSVYREGVTRFAFGDIDGAKIAFMKAKELGFSPDPSENSPEEWLAFLEARSIVPPDVGPPDVPAFAWPPPKASAKISLARSLFVRGDRPMTLKDVSSLLETALNEAEYPTHSFYTVPGGFALAAQLERIQDDGSVFNGRRFEFAISPPSTFTLAEYLKALFRAQSGRYRVIVFIVTSVTIPGPESEVSASVANRWPTTGASGIPHTLAPIKFGEAFECTALVYEFLRPSADSDNIKPVIPSSIPARKHIKSAKIHFGDWP